MPACDVESFLVNGVTLQYPKWSNVNGTGKLPFEIETRGMGGGYRSGGEQEVVHYALPSCGFSQASSP